MALPVNASYPLALYNFRVKVDEISMNFTEVSGIAITYEHVVYRHGLSFLTGDTMMTLRSDSYAPVTLKRGLIPALKPLFLYQWLEKRDLRSMDVTLCDPTGDPLIAWRIAMAVPVKLTAPSFDAKTNEAVIDTLEVQAKGVSLVAL